jgi:phosphopantothenoylcysteine decarboxylase/phosphopantothenate--cysteine ligase
MLLRGKKILIGISGGIAAYKICELVRLYKKNGAEVRVVMTPSAVNFVSPLTLSTLSGNEVLINIFPGNDTASTEKIEAKTWHIYTGLWADIFILAPATANTMSKVVNGMCDNILIASLMASRCPVLIVPSMDEDMYVHESTQNNLAKLKEFGYFIMEPETGELASGLFGTGRMPQPESIFEFSLKVIEGAHLDLKDKTVLVTAGPTYEPIDTVRFIGNYSSGKMGFQLARAASHRGAEVTLITGPTYLGTPKHVKRIDVKTSDEMFKAVKEIYKENHYIIMSAAVADFKPKVYRDGKIKKDRSQGFTIETSQTVDILEFLGKNKNSSVLVGFALETENEIENAIDKLKKKNLDLIVLNNPRIKGAGFGTDTNQATLIDKGLNITELELMSKYELAHKIFDKIAG